MANGDTYSDGLSEMYHALHPPRRRQVLQFLATMDQEECTTRELARHITSIEEGIPRDHATGESYRSVYTALAQTHLPCLADADIVRYNDDRNVVRRGKMLFPALLLLRLNQAVYQTLYGESELPSGARWERSIAD